MTKPKSFKEKQEEARLAEVQRLQNARAGAVAGAFIDQDLERLRTIGGSGLLRPRAERGAPAQSQVNGALQDVTDVEIEQGTPEFWVRYLFDEIISGESKNILAGYAQRATLLDFYNRNFVRPDDFEQVARPYVLRKHRTIREGCSPDEAGATVLRSQLRAAMDIGFEWMQWPADRATQPAASAATSVSYMLEIQKKTVHTPLVWRTEDFRTLAELRTTGFTRQVTVERRISALGMDQSWNPYSTDEVRNRLWYRRQNTDNCLYTGISVALNPFASLVFPKITLSPTTLAPVANAALQPGATPESALLDQNGEVHPRFAPYVARLELPGRKPRLCLYSRARAILMALEGKYLDTQGVQARGQSNRDQAFPEYGSLGVTGENVFAQVELHRFFHGWRDDEGFTAFVNPQGCEMVDRAAIVACFGESQAQTGFYARVESAYNEVRRGGPFGLSWGASGGGHNKLTPQFSDAVGAWVDGRRITLR